MPFASFGDLKFLEPFYGLGERKCLSVRQCQGI